MGINDRFLAESPGIGFLSPVTPQIIYQSAETFNTGDAETVALANIYMPKGTMAPGTTFRVTVSGVKAGTADTGQIALSLNGTAVLTLTCGANTAVDFLCVGTVIQKSPKVQESCGVWLHETEDAAVNRDAGAVDCSGDTTFTVSMINTSASDEMTVYSVTIEYWLKND